MWVTYIKYVMTDQIEFIVDQRYTATVLGGEGALKAMPSECRQYFPTSNICPW